MDLRWSARVERPSHRSCWEWAVWQLKLADAARSPTPANAIVWVVLAILAAYGLTYGVACFALGFPLASFTSFGLLAATLLVLLFHLNQESLQCTSLLLTLTLIAFSFTSTWTSAGSSFNGAVWALWAPQLLLHLGAPVRQAWVWLLCVLAVLTASTGLRLAFPWPWGIASGSTAPVLLDVVTLALQGIMSLAAMTLSAPAVRGALRRASLALPATPSSRCFLGADEGNKTLTASARSLFPCANSALNLTPSGLATAADDPHANVSALLNFSFSGSFAHCGDSQVRCGSLLFIRLHHLEASMGHLLEGSLHEVHQASVAFTTAVLEAVKQTSATLHHIAQDQCFLAWNFGQPCRLHVQNACEASIMIRNALQAPNTAGLSTLISASMGLWSGFLTSRTIAHEDSRIPSVLGPGVNMARGLQQYAAATGRTIVVNAEAQRRAAGLFRWKFIAVDVLVTKLCTSIDQLETENVPSGLVYTLDSELVMPQDEWMYQLQVAARDEGAAMKLEGLLLEAQRGIRDHNAYDRALASLADCSDAPVADTAKAFYKHLRAGALAVPYCQQWISLWLPSHIAHAQLKRKERTRSVTFHLGLPMFSTRRKSSARPSDSISPSTGEFTAVRQFSSGCDSLSNSNDSGKHGGRPPRP